MDTIFTDGQLTKFIETLRQKGMTPERFNLILSRGIFADVCDSSACLDRDAIRIALKLGVVMPDPTPFMVNYGQSLEQMIGAGCYDWVNSDITAKRFPIIGEGIVEFEARLFLFNRGISSEKAVDEIKNADSVNPWNPGKIEHILAFGAKCPEEQRKYPVVSLGSVARVRGRRRVPYLYRDRARRDLNLRWWDGDWDDVCRFLAVRKLSSGS